jgi:hypothetical protein
MQCIKNKTESMIDSAFAIDALMSDQQGLFGGFPGYCGQGIEKSV